MSWASKVTSQNVTNASGVLLWAPGSQIVIFSNGEVQSTPVISRLLGAKIREARVKWFSRYLALSREGHDSQIQDHKTHTPKRLQLSNSMLSDNRGTYVSRISTHIDIAPATNHNKQH